MDFFADMWYVLLILHLIACGVASAGIPTKHTGFWWMLFFGIPFGYLITMVRDIHEKACSKQ